MSTITKQMQELLFDDDRDNVALARIFGLHRNTLSGIRNNRQTLGLKFCIDYVAEKNWRWQIVGRNYPGDPWQQIRCAIAESGHNIESLCEMSGCERRTIDNLFRGVRTPHVKTIDKVATALGLKWILMEAG